MSHTTTIKTVPLRSRTAIAAAVEELNKNGVRCKLTENKAPRMYRANQFKLDTGKQHADLCLELQDGQYDVGFVWNEKDQKFDVVFDSWANNTAKFLGAKGATKQARGGLNGTDADIGYFVQLYTKHAVSEQAAAEGHFVEDCYVDEKTGEIHMTLSNY